MSGLKALLARRIRRLGPISVAEYMNICLLHPTHGYYMRGDPLGRQGDFTTAPEISQMFGEMLGAALVECWRNQGQPAPFALAELGPGRGTLMADILRVGQSVPDFLTAANPWLVEASPVLRDRQERELHGRRARWTTQISGLPEMPVFLVANEFFDALPIRQFVCTGAGWQERMIGLDGDDLVFGLATPIPHAAFSAGPEKPVPGDLVEVSPAGAAIMSEIAHQITAHGGAAIIVDYGHAGQIGETFQAVRGHAHADPLADPGQADLTAHVDFAALARAARAVSATGLTDQGVLLERLGIASRAKRLATWLEGSALRSHLAAYRRLTHPDEMGSLFKAMAFHANGTTPPPGFD